MGNRGDWMFTFTGKRFHPMDPTPEEICIEDIAHALSMLCRYNGHCSQFYSVAEHSVYVSNIAPEEFALEALLHDASEAYICDVPRPLKPYLRNYKEIEDKVERAIYNKFGILRTDKSMAAVKKADNDILGDEMAKLVHLPEYYKNPFPVLGTNKIRCFSPEQAELYFMDRFTELMNGRPIRG